MQPKKNIQKNIHQQLPVEELSHTLVACPVIFHFAVDVRWRQTYLQMSPIQEYHWATCLAHLRTCLNKRERKLLSRSPSFCYRILTSTGGFSSILWVSALTHEESATFPPLTHLLTGHFSLSCGCLQQNTLRTSLCGVCVRWEECTLHEMWSQDFSLRSSEIRRRIRTTCGIGTL